MTVFESEFSGLSSGIAMDEFRYNRKDYGLFPIYQEFVFKIWDFGGQEDFYATHQCFLSTLALYLLVWNLEEGKADVPLRGGGVLTIRAYTRRLCPKGVPFLGFKYIKG